MYFVDHEQRKMVAQFVCMLQVRSFYMQELAKIQFKPVEGRKLSHSAIHVQDIAGQKQSVKPVRQVPDHYFEAIPQSISSSWYYDDMYNYMVSVRQTCIASYICSFDIIIAGHQIRIHTNSLCLMMNVIEVIMLACTTFTSYCSQVNRSVSRHDATPHAQ